MDDSVESNCYSNCSYDSEMELDGSEYELGEAQDEAPILEGILISSSTTPSAQFGSFGAQLVQTSFFFIIGPQI